MTERTGSAGSSGGAFHDSWDAGDMGCGDLVLALRGRMMKLPPGSILRLVAEDPGAPEDLPAWCRLTRHQLIRFEHPVYYIQRRTDDA